MADAFTVFEPSGGDDAAAIQSLYAAGAKSVMLIPTEDYSFASMLYIPPKCRLAGQGRATKINKAYNGFLFKLGQESSLIDLKFDGRGDLYSGGGILIDRTPDNVAEHYQTIRGVCGTSRDHVLKFWGWTSGSNARVIDCFFTCGPDTTVPAIKLPDVDDLATGNRVFQYVTASGGYLFDLAGAHNTIIDGCNGAGVKMGAESRSTKIVNCRFGDTTGYLRLRGRDHQIHTNSIACPWVVEADCYASLINQTVCGSGVIRNDPPSNGNLVYV